LLRRPTDDFSGFVQISFGFMQAGRGRLPLAFSQQNEIAGSPAWEKCHEHRKVRCRTRS
jgi:hypothetical protein